MYPSISNKNTHDINFLKLQYIQVYHMLYFASNFNKKWTILIYIIFYLYCLQPFAMPHPTNDVWKTCISPGFSNTLSF